MKFVVLGSGTALPDTDRGSAGFAVEHQGSWWWIDGGSGTVQRSARAGIDPLTLAGGVYSHHHPDHVGDLVPLLFAQRVAQRKQVYPIWAGEGFASWFDAMRAPWGRWIDTPIEVHEIPRDGEHSTELAPGLLLRTAPAHHSAAALHLRFDTQVGSVVFSGDTARSEALVRLADGVDLLVCECAGSDEQPVAGHLSPTEVTEIATRAQPGEIWLTHLYPHVAPALALTTVAASGVATRRARDGDRWER